MAMTIDELPPHARVWVYKCDRRLTDEEQRHVVEQGGRFLRSWSSHGAPLTAAIGVWYERFVVLGVDEQQVGAGGCSIDESVHFIRELERGMGLKLTDRMVLWVERDGRHEVLRIDDVPALLRGGELNADTMVYDDLLSTRADLQTRFRVPLRQTWMAHYL